RDERTSAYGRRHAAHHEPRGPGNARTVEAAADSGSGIGPSRASGRPERVEGRDPGSACRSPRHVTTTVRYDSPGREADVATRPAALRVMLVDDHPIVRRGLRDLLADAFAGAIIHEVGSGREAIAALHTHSW